VTLNSFKAISMNKRKRASSNKHSSSKSAGEPANPFWRGTTPTHVASKVKQRKKKEQSRVKKRIWGKKKKMGDFVRTKFCANSLNTREIPATWYNARIQTTNMGPAKVKIWIRGFLGE